MEARSSPHLRQIGEEARQRPALRGDIGQQPRGGEQGIVEAEPVAAEKDVTAHLARERRAGLLHLLLDQRVARLPHQGHEAGALQHLRQHLGALDVEDDRLAGAEAPRQIAAEQHEQLVAEHRLASLVHRPDAVAVAVERDAELGVLLHDGGLQVLQVLEHRGVGVMVRERPVRLGEQRYDVGAEPLQRVDRDQAPDAVAAVHNHLRAPGQRRVAGDDGVAVLGEEGAVAGEPTAGPSLRAVVLDHLAEVLDLLAVDRLVAQHQLEAVELGGIVGARDLHPAVHVEGMGREVQRGRGTLPHVHCRAPRRHDPGAHGVRQVCARRTVVPSHGEPRGAAQPRVAERRDGRGNGVRDLGGELIAHGAADVVLPEDGGGDVHGGARPRISGPTARSARR